METTKMKCRQTKYEVEITKTENGTYQTEIEQKIPILTEFRKIEFACNQMIFFMLCINWQTTIKI